MQGHLLLILLTVAACSGTDSAPAPDEIPSELDGGGGPGDGPVFLSFNASVTELTAQESVRFVAILTHPDGLDELVGGQLTDESGTIVFGAFVADQQGTYSLDLSWEQINQGLPIDFDAAIPRSFVAQFYDVAAVTITRSISVTLHCDGLGACDGECTDLRTADNCGACGVECGPSLGCNGETCESGSFTECSLDIPAAETCEDICSSQSKRCVDACGPIPSSHSALWGSADFQCVVNDHGRGCFEPIPAALSSFMCCCSL